jgi:transposase
LLAVRFQRSRSRSGTAGKGRLPPCGFHISKLKHFRRVATRYDKLAANFLAMVQLASMRLWLSAYESTA